MKKASAKKTVRGSLRATKSLVSKIGGKLTPASGAWLEKGDGRVKGRFRIETKCPPTQQYRLYHKDWVTIWVAAVRAGEVAVFHIKLGPHDIILMRESDYRGLGGSPRPDTTTLTDGVVNSFKVDVRTWEGLQVLRSHWFVCLGAGDGRNPSVLLRMMPQSDFIRLANKEVSA